VLLLVIIVAVASFVSQRRRSEHLQERFGPEDDRAAHELGGKGKAESELREREKRVEKHEIHPLNAEDRTRFGDAWNAVQAHFVDDPSAAILDAERLVKEVLQARGYLVGSFEQRSADISVDHPTVLENYRAARAIADRKDQGQATTEDLRQGMVHYRTLFADLLETTDTYQEVNR
jgi:hypothetical protein